MKIDDFQRMKNAGTSISMTTCYDAITASIINESHIDCILVGDSAGMVMHGFDTTIPVTMDMMVEHVSAVARGTNKFIIGDMPFLSYRQGLSHAMGNVERLMQAGAHAIKLEGVAGNEELISHVVSSGVPVMGHLGLTPQSVHQLGGFKAQAKTAVQADYLLKQALQCEQAGCFAIVLEAIPADVAKKVTDQLAIPTIGIGAGPYTSGQVLVLHDLLGMNPSCKPRFVKEYLNGFALMQGALNDFDREVKAREFPDTALHCFKGAC